MTKPARLALAAALALCAACSGGDCESRGEGPNVVVLVIDTLRADRLPFYGYPKDTAPFLSSLAERGVVFERAWATSSWTAPATASIFTGLYPFQHGVTQGIKLVKDIQEEKNPSLLLNRIPRELVTLPETMRGLGYRTFGIAANPNICEEEGFPDGFCRFAGFEYPEERMDQRLAAWADEIRSGGKWFVYLHYMDPHFPYHPREPWFDPPPGPKPDVKKASREVGVPYLNALYDSEVRYVDERVRRAFELLGVDDDTVVVFVADHGEELMQRSDVMQHDFKLYSELTRVPLVIHHPGVTPARKRVRQNVSQVDLLPTLCEILGAPAPRDGAGTSLVPYYTEPAERPNDRAIFSMRFQLPEQGGAELHSVVRGDEKVILLAGPRGERTELYDLASDWDELADLSPERGERARELLGLWEEFERGARVWTRETERKTFDEDSAQRLLDIGYAGDDEPAAGGAKR